MRLAYIFHPYDPTLVIVSVSVAMLAAYVSLELAGRIRATTGGVRFAWLAAGGVSLGGGIWSMHFIGMLALVLPVPVTYDVRLTVLSFVIPIILGLAGLYVVFWHDQSWPRLISGGVMIGVGIIAMHYVGMAAIRMPAMASYEPFWVTVSVVIALTASTIAVWLPYFSLSAVIRFCGSSLGFAIAGMHYTSVAGYICTPTKDGSIPLGGLSPHGLAPWVAGVSLVLLWTILVLAAYNRRVEQFVREADVQAALHNAGSELARVARLFMVGELTALIAHEINQPLGAIVTSANAGRLWLARSPPNIDEAQQLLYRIASDADRASQVIARIRTFLRRDAAESGPIDINDMIRQVLALVRNEIEGHKTTVRTELAVALPPVIGDKVQLEQVVLNLVLNAIEAMAEVSERPRELLIRSQLDAWGAILVSVDDTGTGLDPTALDKIFNTLFTTKPKGIGLGLSISRSIIEAHGGHLWASPGSPHGASFHFSLPTRTVSAA